MPRMALWTPTAQCFVQHQISHTLNFWRLGYPAVYHLESLSDGRAKLNLSFCLPSPSEIIPPPPSFSHPIPPQYPRRPGAPTPPPKRPTVPLFPPGEAPLQTPRPSPVPRQAPALSSKQRKSHRRAVLHRASQATPSLPPALPGTLRGQCAKLLQQAVLAVTKPSAPFPQHPQQQAVSADPKPSPPLPPSKRPRISSTSTSSPLKESSSPSPEGSNPGPSPSHETLRGASPLNSSLSLSLDHASQQRRDAPLSPLTLDFPMEEPKGSVKEVSDADCDVSSDVEEEEKTKEDIGVEEPKSKEEKESKEVDSVKEESEKEADKKEELSHLDLAESWSSWLKRHRAVMKLPESVCDLCERGKENFKYGSSKRRDCINSLEDLAEQLYKWKSPGVAYGEKRKYEPGYNSMADNRRMAIKYHGLDVTCVNT